MVNRIAGIEEKEEWTPILILFSLQVLAFILLYLIQQLTQILERKLEFSFGQKIKERIMNKIQGIQYITFEKPDFYNGLQRLDTGQSKVIRMVSGGLSFVRDVITILSVLGFLLTINWFLIPILLIGITPVFIIQMKFGSKRFFLTRDLTPYRRKESYTADLLKRRESLKEIKIFGLEKFLLQRWREYYELNSNKQINILIKQSIWLFLARIFLMITYAASGLLVIFMIIGKEIMVGSFVAILQAVERVQNSLNTIAQSLSEFYESSFLIGELISFLKLKERNDRQSMKYINGIHELKIVNLSFNYPNEKEPTIENINFSITPGKKIAIVGENGSGKTTLIKCLTGLYDSNKSIEVNGEYLENINLQSYHKHLAVLFQDFNKYHFTAHENIGFGRIENMRDFQRVRSSAKQTGIDSYISSLEESYESPLGRLFDNGSDLSGGQWQRIALSRALFRNSDLIVLDEPTASLDPSSEVEIVEELFDTIEKQSILFITHRLGAARLADEIIVMKEGRIAERGSHDELLNLNGEYQKMFKLQSKWYKENQKGELIQ